MWCVIVSVSCLACDSLICCTILEDLISEDTHQPAPAVRLHNQDCHESNNIYCVSCSGFVNPTGANFGMWQMSVTGIGARKPRLTFVEQYVSRQGRAYFSQTLWPYSLPGDAHMGHAGHHQISFADHLWNKSFGRTVGQLLLSSTLGLCADLV